MEIKKIDAVDPESVVALGSRAYGCSVQDFNAARLWAGVSEDSSWVAVSDGKVVGSLLSKTRSVINRTGSLRPAIVLTGFAVDPDYRSGVVMRALADRAQMVRNQEVTWAITFPRRRGMYELFGFHEASEELAIYSKFPKIIGDSDSAATSMATIADVDLGALERDIAARYPGSFVVGAENLRELTDPSWERSGGEIHIFRSQGASDAGASLVICQLESPPDVRPLVRALYVQAASMSSYRKVWSAILRYWKDARIFVPRAPADELLLQFIRPRCLDSVSVDSSLAVAFLDRTAWLAGEMSVEPMEIGRIFSGSVISDQALAAWSLGWRSALQLCAWDGVELTSRAQGALREVEGRSVGGPPYCSWDF